MKVRDSNGELKEVVIKTNDSIPAGAVIDYDGDVVPEGYEKVEDNIKDYVVEQGTNDGFIYRKWNSGILEQYGTKSFDTLAMTNSYDNAYFVSTDSISFATAFVEKPTVILTPCIQTAIINALAATIGKTSFVGYLWGNTSKTLKNVSINISAIGRWKE